MDEAKYITINLDIPEDRADWEGTTFGPFDKYEDAVDFGNRTMSFFGVSELHEPWTE